MYPKFTADPLADQQPLTPFQRLMPAIRKRFGMIPPAEISRIKRLRPEQQETLLDVVVMASSLDYFLAQIPGDPAPPRSTRPAEPLTQRLGPALASALGRERSSSQAQAPDFGEPPLIPRQDDKLAQAIGMLTDWRTISGDPQNRRTLKALLTRFPENNYQAGLWLQRLQEVLVEREREAVPGTTVDPNPQTEEPVREAVAPAVPEPMHSQMEEPRPETAEAVTPAPEEPVAAHISVPESEPQSMPLPETVMPSDSGAVAISAATSTPPVAIAPAATLPVTLPELAGTVFQVATAQPFPAEIKLLQGNGTDAEGNRQLAVVLTVPTEELKFAQGVARRIPDLAGLEARLVAVMRGYFLAVEQELTRFRQGAGGVAPTLAEALELSVFIPGKPVPVPTTQPFHLTVTFLETPLETVPVAGWEPQTQLAVMFTVPDEALGFAQGVARRVRGFVGLETRLTEAVQGYFVAAEQELFVFSPAPAALAVAVATVPLVEAGEPEAELLTPAVSSATGVETGNGQVETEPFHTTPEPTLTVVAPAVEAAFPTSKPMVSGAASPTSGTFHQSLTALFVAVSETGIPWETMFSRTTLHTLQRNLRQESVPHRKTIVTLLRELAAHTGPERSRFAPLVQNLLTVFQSVRGRLPGNRLAESEVAALNGLFAKPAVAVSELPAQPTPIRETVPELETETSPEQLSAPETAAGTVEDGEVALEQPLAADEAGAFPVPAEMKPQLRSQPAPGPQSEALPLFGGEPVTQAVPSALAAEARHKQDFLALVAAIRNHKGGLARIFPEQVLYLVKGVLKQRNRDKILIPASFLRVMQALEQVPEADLRALWPFIQPVLESYPAARQDWPAYLKVEAELAAVKVRLTEAGLPAATVPVAEPAHPAEPIGGTIPQTVSAAVRELIPGQSEEPQRAGGTGVELPNPSAEAETTGETQGYEAAEGQVHQKSSAPQPLPVAVLPALKKPLPKATDKEFFASFRILVESLRSRGTPLTQAFPGSLPPAKHALRGDTVPQPASFLRILQDLARLPLATRDHVWPHLPPVLAAYEGLRGQTPEFAAQADELAATVKGISPDTAFVAAFQTLVDALKTRFGDLLRVFPSVTHVHVRDVIQKKIIPSPNGFLKMLGELARLPRPDRQALWPQVEAVLDRYQKLGKGQRQKPFQEEFELLAGRLAER